MRTLVITFLIGVLFSVGFALGGVTKPETIVGFLDFFGDWDPSVLLVMGAAVPVTFLLYRLTFRRERPLLDSKFLVPTRRDIDGRLVGGAVLFGAGWGLIGFCPGPVLASLTTGISAVYVFLVAMVAGMVLFSAYDKSISAQRPARPQRAPFDAAPAEG